MSEFIIGLVIGSFVLTIGAVLPLSYLHLRKLMSNSLHIVLRGEDIAEIKDNPPGYSGAFARKCNGSAGAYEKYVTVTATLSDKDFNNWLSEVKRESRLIPNTGEREWGLQARFVVDPVPAHALFERLRMEVEDSLATVDYFVGLSSMGELIATYLAAFSNDGTVLPFNMQPSDEVVKHSKHGCHVMIVDTAINSGRHIGYAKQWIDSLHSERLRLTIAVGVYNRRFDQSNVDAVALINQAEVHFVKERDAIPDSTSID